MAKILTAFSITLAFCNFQQITITLCAKETKVDAKL